MTKASHGWKVADEAYTRAALVLAGIALSLQSAKGPWPMVEYNQALSDLRAAAEARKQARVRANSGEPGSPIADTVGGPRWTDREVESSLCDYERDARPESRSTPILRELWERVRLLVNVDYEIGGSGNIVARAFGKDGMEKWRRVFLRQRQP